MRLGRRKARILNLKPPLFCCFDIQPHLDRLCMLFGFGEYRINYSSGVHN